MSGPNFPVAGRTSGLNTQTPLRADGTIDPQGALQAAINNWVANGYHVVSQTPTTAQLVKPKQFSIVWFLLWLLLAVFPAILYVAYYVAKRDRTVYLTVDPNGTIRQS